MSELYDRLSKVESFDSKALVGDEEVPQTVCDLVLALSLFYVDFKDSIVCYEALTKTKPKGDFAVRKEWGAYCGMEQHVARYQLGLIHELLKLIAAHRSAVRHQFMQAVVRTLDVRARTAWKAIADVATDKASTSLLARNLHMARNKISFHFDARALGGAYRRRFVEGDAGEAPMLSRGTTMEASRFYFADATAQEFLNRQFSEEGSDLTADQLGAMIHDLNFAILQLVCRFINRRSSYREVPVSG